MEELRPFDSKVVIGLEKKLVLGTKLESMTRRGKADEATVEKLLDDRLKQIVEEMKGEG